MREIFAERKALIDQYVPGEVRAVHAQVVTELKARNAASGTLATGIKAPVFELQDHNGKVVSSQALLSQGPLVVCFLRGRWCPFCVAQLEALDLITGEILQAGGAIVAISPQTVQQSFFMHDQHKPHFPLLSDPGNRTARQFGLVYRVPDYQQTVYKRAFINLPFANGDSSWELPIPATFVIGSNGTVVYASANEDYTERPEPTEILHAVTSFSNPA